MILALCHRSGVWADAYGGGVECIDTAEGGADVRTVERPAGSVTGVIAEPPCTHLAGSGARWWADKGEGALLEALSIVDACIRVVTVTRPDWWVLENPVGRLSRYLGPPVATFQPWEYALYADDPDAEAYTKRTCLWGRFVMPPKAPHPDGAVRGGVVHRMGPSEDRADKRSQTPQGFSRAFASVNPSFQQLAIQA